MWGRAHFRYWRNCMHAVNIIIMLHEHQNIRTIAQMRNYMQWFLLILTAPHRVHALAHLPTFIHLPICLFKVGHIIAAFTLGFTWLQLIEWFTYLLACPLARSLVRSLAVSSQTVLVDLLICSARLLKFPMACPPLTISISMYIYMILAKITDNDYFHRVII